MSKPERDKWRNHMQRHTPIRCFFGFDEVEELRRMKRAGEPFIFLDHAYFHRGYRPNGYFRVIYNGIHRTNALDLPGDRLERMKVKVLDWKDGRDHVVLIPAPKNIEKLYGPWNTSAVERLIKVTRRQIKVKAKTDGSLGDFLHRSWGLVAHSSVAAVEAACLGFPVFGPETSPAYPVSGSMDDIETPVRPDREPWLRTLAYSQFTTSEIENGTAWGIIKETERL